MYKWFLAGAIALAMIAGPARAAEPDWSAWRSVLEAHVSPGVIGDTHLNIVDYSAIHSDARFTEAVETVRGFDVTRLEGETEHLAFYINAYNILTLRLVLDHGPVDSIRDIGNFFRGPWDIVVLENADGELTLDDIEHEIIRSYPEPRIHFAVNCASVGCPDLRREPYLARRLDTQLDEQTREFLADPARGFRRTEGSARVSKIFRWYREDFEAGGGVAAFVARYVDVPVDDVSANLPYDWQLNGKKR